MLLPAGILLPGALQEAKLLSMSTLNEEGVMDVKQTACERLLTSRVEVKMQVGRTPRTAASLAAALHVDQEQRAPASVSQERSLQRPACSGQVKPAACLHLSGGWQWPVVCGVTLVGWQATTSHCSMSVIACMARLLPSAALLPLAKG